MVDILARNDHVAIRMRIEVDQRSILLRLGLVLLLLRLARCFRDRPRVEVGVCVGLWAVVDVRLSVAAHGGTNESRGMG